MLPDDVLRAICRVGEDLAMARRARRMSQADMAARIGVGRSTIVRMEAGDPRIGFATIASAA